MAKTGNVRGDVIVGDAGNPEVVIPLSLATATVTKQQSGKTVVSASGTLTLSLSGSAPMQLIYIKIVANATKQPLAATFTITPGAIAVPACTELLMVAYTGAAITQIVVNIPATEAEVEFLIAG